MEWLVYKNSLIMGLRQVSNYRGELWFQVLTKVISLGSLALLWFILLQDSPRSDMNNLVGYLLIANGVREFFDAFYMKSASFIMETIKSGELNALLLRPVNPYGFLFFNFQGTRGTNILFALISIGGGIWLSPPTTIWGAALFTVAMIVGAILGFCVNVLTAELAFWFVQAGNMRTAIVHTTKVLSGSMVPLNFFPEVARKSILLTPFPAFAYLPTRLLQGEINQENVVALVVQVLWAGVALRLTDYYWKRGLKKYEAVGI